MKAVFVTAGFSASKARLQPWRSIGELARGLAAHGHEVTLLTDVPASDAATLPGVLVVPEWDVPRLCHRGRRPPASNGEQRVVFWNVGRLAPLYPLRRRAGDRDIAILTAPLYSHRELALISRSFGPRTSEAAIHLAGAAIPMRLLARHLASHYDSVVTLAGYAAERLVAAGLPGERVTTILPGFDPLPASLDAAVIPAASGPDEARPPVFTYAGNASLPRGADLLIRAFARAFAGRPEARLRLAIRHEDDSLSPDEARLDALIGQLGVRSQVERFGNLRHDELLALFRDSTAVVLPFRLVPSEAPLMPLEIASVGTRLITTNLPPLRGVAGAGTLMTKPGSIGSLRRALVRAAEERPAVPERRPRRSWADAAAELERLAFSGARRETHDTTPGRVVYLCGNDGTGKTTQASLMVDALRERGLAARYIWLRFPQLLSIPVLLTSRLMGVTRYETIDGRRSGRWEFWRAPWLAHLLLWTQVVDAAIFRAVRIDRLTRAGTSVVLDRFALDIVVDIAAAAHDAGLVDSLPARLLVALTTSWPVIVLDAEADAIRDRRPDLAHDGLLDRRADLYRRVAARRNGALRIDARQAIDAIHDQIMQASLGVTR